jgi:exonuclease III
MMKDHIASKDTTNFTYLQCGTEEKSLSDSFTLLNLNVCFLPGGLPLLYGGVLPWNDRIQKVADRILSLDADIICLQEVFERRSALGLYEKLKDRYSHFYLDIGPKNFGLTHTDAGLGSGLFVASKLPIKNPSFTPFQKKNENVNRGFFQFDIEKEGLKVARVFTTHLEAFNDKVSQQNRHNQLETIIETMRKQKEVNGNAPLQILCGDLNIPWGSKEPAEDLLQSCFNDSYCHSVTSLCDATRTYVDFTDFWWKAKGQVASFSPQPEILDYAVHLKGEYALPSSPCMITASCAMNDIKQPLQAISDHHGLISWVDISKNLYNCK